MRIDRHQGRWTKKSVHLPSCCKPICKGNLQWTVHFSKKFYSTGIRWLHKRETVCVCLQYRLDCHFNMKHSKDINLRQGSITSSRWTHTFTLSLLYSHSHTTFDKHTIVNWVGGDGRRLMIPAFLLSFLQCAKVTVSPDVFNLVPSTLSLTLHWNLSDMPYKLLKLLQRKCKRLWANHLNSCFDFSKLPSLIPPKSSR